MPWDDADPWQAEREAYGDLFDDDDRSGSSLEAEQAAVLWEREPDPNYDEDYEEMEVDWEAYAAQQEAETLAEIERKRKAKRLAYELLVDDRGWW